MTCVLGVSGSHGRLGLPGCCSFRKCYGGLHTMSGPDLRGEEEKPWVIHNTPAA